MVKVRLGELLMNPESFDWKLALYLPPLHAEWTLDAVAILHDPDDVDSDDPDAIPEPVNEASYRYVLSLHDVCGVINNARLQGARLSEGLAFDAVLFFLDNDAFQAQRRARGSLFLMPDTVNGVSPRETGELDRLGNRLRSQISQLLIPLQTGAAPDHSDFDRLMAIIEDFAVASSGLDSLPRSILNELWTTCRILRNEANHGCTGDGELGSMADRLERVFELLLKGESVEDRRAGTPRIV